MNSLHENIININLDSESNTLNLILDNTEITNYIFFLKIHQNN